MMNGYEKRLTRSVSLLQEATAVTVFSGAGISTESGLSDFRSPGGVWDRYRIVTYQEFLASAEARKEYWRMKHALFGELREAKPNRAHRALAALERAGKLQHLITQNIDGLHQEAGNSPERIVELHGTNRKALCLDCGKWWPIEQIDATLEAVGFDPRCDVCEGPVKPATVSFGQAMPETEMLRAWGQAAGCDLLLMLGSSLQVEPAASIPRLAHSEGANLIFVNRTETPQDHLATVLFREDIGQVVQDLMVRLPSRHPGRS
jgi:NAD-dependent deacetylase